MLLLVKVVIDNAFSCRYLHNNKLTGSIPRELGNMSKLHYLYENFMLGYLFSILYSFKHVLIIDDALTGN